VPLEPHFATRGAPPGSLRWHARLYAPAAGHGRLEAAFALEAELRDAVRPGLEHGVAHAKLGWWAEEAARLRQGGARHPITLALESHGDQAVQDAEALDEMLAAAATELAQLALHDEAELDAYLRGAGAACQRLAIGAATPSAITERFAVGCGTMLRLTEIIRDLRQDAWHGRVFVPWTWLEAEGIDLEQLRGAEPADGLRRSLQRLATKARSAWSEARSGLDPAAADPLRPLIVLAELHRALLDRMERNSFDVGRQRVDLPPLLRLITAWRAARRA
jgi:15-cis-phytoene synthase